MTLDACNPVPQASGSYRALARVNRGGPSCLTDHCNQTPCADHVAHHAASLL